MIDLEVQNLYTDLKIFDNIFRYIGIPRTATQSINKFLTLVDDRFENVEGKNLEICVIRNPIDRLLSAIRHHKDSRTLNITEISILCQTDEHYLPFTDFSFFQSLNEKTILIPYNKNIVNQIKNIIETNYNIIIKDIEIPKINVTEEIKLFSCPYRHFVNQNLKTFKKIYKKDIEFYQTMINSKKL